MIKANPAKVFTGPLPYVISPEEKRERKNGVDIVVDINIKNKATGLSFLLPMSTPIYYCI